MNQTAVAIHANALVRGSLYFVESEAEGNDMESKSELGGIVRSGRTFNVRGWRLPTQPKTPAYRQAGAATACGAAAACSYGFLLKQEGRVGLIVFR
jgi:hypothetical protein